MRTRLYCLAAASEMAMLLGLAIPCRPATAADRQEMTAAELEAIWADLAQDDEAASQRVPDHIRTLAGSPRQVVEFLQTRLRPTPPPDAQSLRRWIADLNSPVFSRRTAASAELEKLGPLAGPALRKELGRSPALEVARRIEDLLQRLDRRAPPPAELRVLRAIEVLEAIGSQPAHKLLEELGKGAEGAERTGAAKAALQRLTKR